MSRKPQPLLIDEVPENVRAAYDFKSHVVIGSNGNQCSTIERRCLSCQARDRVSVSSVRASIKANRLSGLCNSCRAKKNMKSNRKTPSGVESNNWKGGRYVDKKGYILILDANRQNSKTKYTFEHRLVMEKHLGRPLLRTETVHHKNGDRQDNRIDNLELWRGSHGNGKRYADMTPEDLEKEIAILQEILKSKRANPGPAE